MSSSHVVVEVDPLRKATIKVIPSTTLKQVIIESCQKLKLDNPDGYELKYKRNKLDLSLSIRFANLAPGAKLELIRSTIPNKQVKVALQMDDGSRIMEIFTSNTNLLDFLIYYQTKYNDGFNLLYRPGKMNSSFLIPQLNFMNQEFSTIEALKTTTLNRAGLSDGSGLFRLSFKDTAVISAQELNDLIYQTNSTDKMGESSSGKGDSNSAPSRPMTAINNKLNPSSTPKKEESGVSSSEDPKAISSKSQNASSATTTAKSENTDSKEDVITVLHPSYFEQQTTDRSELPESFYELSGTELKMMMADQSNKVHSIDEKPLLTKTMREKLENEQKKKYPKTNIRVRFPDGFVVGMGFDSESKIDNLYEKVKTTLVNPITSFQLFITPPKEILEKTKTFWDYHLSPAANVYITSQGIELHPSFKSQAKTSVISTQLSSSSNSINKVSIVSNNSTNGHVLGGSLSSTLSSQRSQSASSKNESSDPNTIANNDKPKIPKWLRLGK